MAGLHSGFGIRVQVEPRTATQAHVGSLIAHILFTNLFQSMGRPSKFKEEFVTQAEKLCKLGATDIEIADFFDVDVRTIYRWKAENDAFCHALKSGKEDADERVERSLFSRAIGYEHEEVDIRVVSGEIVQTPIRKYYPPDTTAGIFWLKNRRAEQWRDKQDVSVNHSGSIEHGSISEIAARIEELLGPGSAQDNQTPLPN